MFEAPRRVATTTRRDLPPTVVNGPSSGIGHRLTIAEWQFICDRAVLDYDMKRRLGVAPAQPVSIP
jgi:hypothetical protein